MLNEDDIRVDVGRAQVGDFMRMIHLPTGIERLHRGPLKAVNRDELCRQWLVEIESELMSKGHTKYISARGK